MKKTVTLKDIAQKTGYSVNTVSHVLNDKPDISDSTKKIIRDAAVELGYIVNGTASALRSGVSRLIAVSMPDISNLHFAVLIKELEKILNQKNYTLMILNTDESSEIGMKALRTAISRGVDGILLCPTQENEDNIRFLRATGVPYVLMGRHFFTDRDSYVIPDNVKGGRLAAQHLLELGHRKLLFVGSHDFISSAKERIQGVREAVQQAGLPENTVTYATEMVDWTRNMESMRALLMRHADHTGIIAFNDMIALEIVSILQHMGKSVPDDYSVVGFDNIQAGYLMPGGLTTVCPCREDMAAKMVASLLDQIENRGDGVRLILDTHLVVRQTTKKVE